MGSSHNSALYKCPITYWLSGEIEYKEPVWRVRRAV